MVRRSNYKRHRHTSMHGTAIVIPENPTVRFSDDKPVVITLQDPPKMDGGESGETDERHCCYSVRDRLCEIIFSLWDAFINVLCKIFELCMSVIFFACILAAVVVLFAIICYIGKVISLIFEITPIWWTSSEGPFRGWLIDICMVAILCLICLFLAFIFRRR